MTRNYALDYARAIMLLVGIPYHIACAYQVGGDWLVDSGPPSVVGTMFAATSHAFRMHAFFMLSGFFASMLLARREWTLWLKDRAMRVLLPAVSTTLVFGPFCMYLFTYSRTRDHDGAIRSVIDGFPLGLDFHTWFLYILFGFCVAFALMRNRIIGGFDRLLAMLVRYGKAWPMAHGPWPMALVVALAVVFFAGWAIVPSVWTRIAGKSAVSDHIYTSLLYLPFFTIGIAAERSTAVSRIVFQPPRSVVAVGLLCLVAYVALDLYEKNGCGGICGPRDIALEKTAHALAGLFTSFAFFGFVHRLSPKQNDIISYVVSGSLVMYLAHLPAVLALAYAFRFVDLPPLLEMAIMNVIVLAWVVLAFEVVRRSRLLRLLFNGGEVRPEVRIGRLRRAGPETQ